MKKRIYRAVSVKDIDAARLREEVEGRPIAVGIDAAKKNFVAALMDAERRVIATLKWEHPRQTRELIALLQGLPVARMDAALEPTGSYGLPIVELLRSAGIGVFRVSAKRTHDAAEVYDGVPSQHDAKAAAIIAKLHWDGASAAWAQPTPEERALAARVATMRLVHGQLQDRLNVLEARLAAHWPEVTTLLDLDSATLLALLNKFGSPEGIARAPDAARQLMAEVGGRLLAQEKIELVMNAAAQTTGWPMIDDEIAALRHLVGEIERDKSLLRQATERVRQAGQQNDAVRAMSSAIGPLTAAVLVSEVGDPRQFANAASFVKAMGLNLAVYSSGQSKKGQLRLSKRGSGTARKYLFLAALRLIKDDPLAKAWFLAKVQRDGGRVRIKGVIAVMRKLARALWHVGRGAVFDTNKLFDARRLSNAGVQPAA